MPVFFTFCLLHPENSTIRIAIYPENFTVVLTF